VKKRVLPIFLLVSLTLATAIQPVIAEPSPSSKQKAVLVTGASSGIGPSI
jgi:NADPH:quinone reductase-like Zn-dependent oxidoreductase